MSDEVDMVRAAVSGLKEEVALLKGELRALRGQVADDMKKVVEVVKQNAK